MWRRLRRPLFGTDLIVLGMAVVLSILVLVFHRRIAHPSLYLLYHLLGVVLVMLTLYGEALTGRRLWTLARHWYPAVLVPAVFREFHFLIPQINPHRYDAELLRIDTLLFGDVRATLLPMMKPAVVDLLHLCYWTYFILPLALALATYRHRNPRPFRAIMSICVFGWFISYLGYLLIPAVGPYAIEAPEALIPQGGVIARTLHAKLLEIEWSMPDAFPSGHVLLTLLVLACAWRTRRTFFWIAALPAIGLILATVALRYHYLVDIIASFALAPVAAYFGLAIHSMTERWKAPVPPTGRP